MAKLSTDKSKRTQLLMNLDHRNPLPSQTLLTISIPPYQSRPSKKSANMKSLQKFQKSGMKWPFWNKKCRCVRHLNSPPPRTTRPCWASQKSWVLKTHSIVEVYSRITCRHAETKMSIKLKENSHRKWTWPEITAKIKFLASLISSASSWTSSNNQLLRFQSHTNFLCNHNSVQISSRSLLCKKRLIESVSGKQSLTRSSSTERRSSSNEENHTFKTDLVSALSALWHSCFL